MRKNLPVKSVSPVKEKDKQSAVVYKVTSNPNKPNYEVRVGIFTILAVIILLYGWTWLKSFSPMHPPQLITVQFHDIAGLATNAPVNINGVRVGTVEKIELKGNSQVLTHLKIKTEEVTVPQGSTFTIQTLGLVGAKYIEITLPEEKPGEANPAPIDSNTVVIGSDPVRVELVINKIATNVNNMIGKVSDDDTQSSFASAIQRSGETIENINEAAKKLNKNMDNISTATDSLVKTSDKFGNVADEAKVLTSNANSFFLSGKGALNDISGLTKDFKTTSQRVNKILESPEVVSDLKQTAKDARQTVQAVKQLMAELETTMKDKSLRKDLIGMLDRVTKSTENISSSMQQINAMAGDRELRSDVKAIVVKAQDAVNKVDRIIGDPEFKGNMRSAINKVEKAAEGVEDVSKQMRQILNKRAPLFHMMVGRPGKLDQKEKSGKAASEKEAESSKTSELSGSNK